MKRAKQQTIRAVAQAAILMGSDSDLSIMQESARALKMFGIQFEVSVLSAHRAPEDTARFAQSALKRGLRVIIAGAGGAAHLAGVVASMTTLPVIGVPIPSGPLHGQDALLSIVQMPQGVPVATVGIGAAFNAGVLAAQILAAGGSKKDEKMLNKLSQYKAELRKKVLSRRVET